MKHQRITLKTLRASAQPRPLVTADVDKLAASIKEIGLIQPITVRAVTVINGVAEGGFQIVAGHHRVAACRALGWDEIDAIVIESAGHLQAELIEIDENLCRSELTASQRIGFTTRRAEIWAALYPTEKKPVNTEVAQPAPPQFSGQLGGARPQEKAFAAATAAITGESKSQINRNLARGKALGDDLPRVQGTSLDKVAEIDALAKLPEPERKDLIDRAQAGEKVTARDVLAPRPVPAEPAPAPASALPVVPPADPTTIDTFAALMARALSDVRRVMQCDSNKAAAQKLAAAVQQASPAQLMALDLVLTDLLELGSVGIDEVVA